MNTAQATTERLRKELGFDRIVAAPDPSADRWCVYEVRRKASGGWEIPYSFGSEGLLVAGVPSFIREVRDFAELVLVHEAPGGGYAEANVHLMLEALRKQDRWRARDVVSDMLRRVKQKKAENDAKASQMFYDLAGEHRRLFVKAAEEMGL